MVTSEPKTQENEGKYEDDGDVGGTTRRLVVKEWLMNHVQEGIS